jgi:FkbM family methyltransferase|tara:strand:+ start:44 stop:667 length:624 start_codon:yes stop_codon:yes gene_type:complete
MNVIVDIGCFNGRTLSLANKLLHRKRENWFGLMVEPNVYLKEDIHKSLEGTNFKYVHCAISDENGTGKLWMGKYGFFNRRSPAQKEKCMRSSLLKEEGFVSQHLTEEYQTVPLKTLQTLLVENDITNVNILKVDTEGNDTKIFASYDWSVMPDEIITEDYVAVRGKTTKPYWEEQDKLRLQKYEIIQSKGYTLTKQEDCNSFWVKQS